MRIRTGRRRNATGQNENEEEDSDLSDDDDGVSNSTVSTKRGKKAKKALRKKKKQKEKRRRREAKEADDEARRDFKSAKELKYQKKIEERERARLSKEKALKDAMREKEERERAEYEAMKSLFEVEKSGSAADEATGGVDMSNWLGDFIAYLENRKVSVIEDVAAEFQLSSREIVERIEALEMMGRVSGVVDDRGKFIFITGEEMQRVADFIREKGRVSLADLAVHSNFLIDLEPKKVETPSGDDEDGDDAKNDASKSGE